MSQVALRLPDSLHQYAKQLAAQDDASLNPFIVMAVAEKMSALNTEAYFQERAKKGSVEAGLAALSKVRKAPPLKEDAR